MRKIRSAKEIRKIIRSKLVEKKIENGQFIEETVGTRTKMKRADKGYNPSMSRRLDNLAKLKNLNDLEIVCRYLEIDIEYLIFEDQ